MRMEMWVSREQRGSIGNVASIHSTPGMTASSTVEADRQYQSLWSVQDEDEPRDRSINGMPSASATTLI
jgi:hypothetical protein